MKIILPMAGNGQRFFDAGYDLPKPLIDVNGKPMFVRVLDNIKYGTDIHVIIRKDHAEKYNLDKLIHQYAPDAVVYILDEPTQGAAETVLKAVDKTSDEGCLVANCDQLMVWDKDKFYGTNNTAGTILTFTPKHNKPIHSYVTLDENGYVTDLAEKRMISNIATVGVYYFNSQKTFAQAATRMFEANDRTNGEFYLAPVYNYIHGNVSTYHCEEFLGMGTPEELQQLQLSEWWNKLDDL